MNNRFAYPILLAAGVLLALLVSCAKEDLPADIRPLGEGESEVAFGVTYRPLAGAALGQTRSEGGYWSVAIAEVWVVGYNPDSRLAGSCYLPHDRLTITDVDDRRPSGETTTQHAAFSCTIPYGRYRIYAVANLGDLTDESRIRHETDFKAIPLTWDPEHIAANCQMSGYFSRSESEAYAKGDAQPVDIDRPNLTLHSWVRRAASKVTVAFDASRLNENIYIYLRSAQIMDIPVGCPLVDANRPSGAEELLHEGDTILFGKGVDYTEWKRLSCGRGANSFGSHANDAPSLFFYENMQGQHPDKHKYQNFESKDNVPCGTYVEVRGYYVNNSADNPSYGNIVYRCMLGRDMTSDFDAERNTHYKLTLVFNADANDPDWHIEYDYVPKPPEIVVPNPMYISYLANQSLDIPVTVYYDRNLVVMKSMTARIIRNDWGYEDHKYYGDPNSTDLKNGFLSLAQSATTQDNYAATKSDYAWTECDGETYRYTIPVYTRPLELGSGFSGNNYYVGRRRNAQVELTAVFSKLRSDGTPDPDDTVSITDTVDVIQVRRLVNPKGIWRKGDSMKPFRVSLKNTNSNPTVANQFDDVVSEGPWTARVLKGAGWVQIKDVEDGEEAWGTTPIVGGTGSKVEFDFRPGSTYASGCRFGLIEITFHNNTCPHLILVSQGIGPVSIGGSKWHMTNVRYCGVDEANPLLEGSMFKFGWSGVAFRSVNNIREGYGFRQEAFYKSFDTFDIDGRESTAVFKDVQADITGFTNAKMNKSDAFGTSHVATRDEWAGLTPLDRFYGVLYGEECSRTLDRNTETNTYTEEGQERGMRGCFVYDGTTNAHLFFPIGNTGHGRRQYRDDYERNAATAVALGALKYANRSSEMPYDTAKKMPCLYDLWEEPGAIYWYQKQGSDGNFGFDINYYTFGFASYSTRRVWDNKTTFYSDPKQDVAQSDICFIRRVYDE